MTNAETEKQPGKSPSHFAWVARETKNGKFWTRIGAAWPTKDGKGFNIQLEAVPLDGRITLLLPSEKDEKSA
jgi:hypothetical protein